MRKLLMKSFIGIYFLLVSAEDNERIFLTGQTRTTDARIGAQIVIQKESEGVVVDPPNFDEYWERIFLTGQTRTSDSGIGHQSLIQKESEGVVVDPPNFGKHWSCGLDYIYLVRVLGYLQLNNGRVVAVPIYHLNETAEKLASEGFNIRMNEVEDDVLTSFTYFNGTYEYTYAYINYLDPLSGGKPAKEAREYYMAQIGEKKDGKIEWLCDGVVLNHRWILSAAHCFAMQNVEPNIMKLGYMSDYYFPYYYPIHQVVPYPEFKINERYHDLVLIQMSRSVPQRDTPIFPICLPWGKEMNRDLVGMDLTVTGRGATEFGGPRVLHLYEVNLTVFETFVCNEAYSENPEIRRKYPNGITKDKILCAGWMEGGKDACGGDSGAPIVYKLEREFILAGIVSGGYGCGLKEYPGLYIPINRPNYLKWIKEVAFKDYM